MVWPLGAMSGWESPTPRAAVEGRFASAAGSGRAMALGSAALAIRVCTRRSRQQKKHSVPTVVLMPRAKKLPWQSQQGVVPSAGWG